MEERHWYWIAAAVVGMGVLLILFNMGYLGTTPVLVTK